MLAVTKYPNSAPSFPLAATEISGQAKVQSTLLDLFFFPHLHLAQLQIISAFLLAGEGAVKDGFFPPLLNVFLRSTCSEHYRRSIPRLWKVSTICEYLTFLEGDIDAGAASL